MRDYPQGVAQPRRRSFIVAVISAVPHAGHEDEFLFAADEFNPNMGTEPEAKDAEEERIVMEIPPTEGSSGVPVLTLLGPEPFARIRASLMPPCGLESLLPDHPKAYVEKAIRLAQNPKEIFRLNPGSRHRMRDSDRLSHLLRTLAASLTALVSKRRRFREP
jgi:hypothetical protein